MVMRFLDNTSHLLLVKFSPLDITDKSIRRLYFHTRSSLVMLKNLM